MKFNNRGAYVPYNVLLKQHEEAQKLKPVLATSITGAVKWFSLRHHYGFIARDDGKGDVFVHQMNIVKSRMNRVYLRSLAYNEKVEFDVVEGKSGPEAANVTGPGGVDVQGVYVIQVRYPFGSRRRRSTSRSQGDNSPQPRGNRRNDRRLSITRDVNSQSGEQNDENKPSQSGENRRRNRRRSGKFQSAGDNDENKAPGSRGSRRRNRHRSNTNGKSQSGENDGEKALASPSMVNTGEKKTLQSLPAKEGNDKEKALHSSPAKEEDDEEKVFCEKPRHRTNTNGNSADENKPLQSGADDSDKQSRENSRRNRRRRGKSQSGENDGEQALASPSMVTNDEKKSLQPPAAKESNDKEKALQSSPVKEENDEKKVLQTSPGKGQQAEVKSNGGNDNKSPQSGVNRRNRRPSGKSESDGGKALKSPSMVAIPEKKTPPAKEKGEKKTLQTSPGDGKKSEPNRDGDDKAADGNNGKSDSGGGNRVKKALELLEGATKTQVPRGQENGEKKVEPENKNGKKAKA